VCEGCVTQDNGMDSPFKDGITMCQAGRLTNQLST
jgi:hypothetical protein